MTREERFWSKVEKGDDCWAWTSANNGHPGHGRFWWNPYRTQAHRASWMLHYGEIPEGACVLHRCDNPCCVRPEHLFLGSQLDNIKDMVSKGRQKSSTHCINGHEFTPENTKKQTTGIYCRICANVSNRAYLARKRAEAK